MIPDPAQVKCCADATVSDFLQTHPDPVGVRPEGTRQENLGAAGCLSFSI